MAERAITTAMLRRAMVAGYHRVRAMPRSVRLTPGQADHIRTTHTQNKENER